MPSAARKERDPRIDVLRGAALLMIFVDHMPRDVVNTVTMHNFGFSDAAELFVLLAGFSAMMAYGGVFDRRGAGEGLRKVARRILWIYAAQIMLLFVSLVAVKAWGHYFGLEPTIVAPMLQKGGAGARQVASGVVLMSQPGYLDILPIYIVLLGAFPLIYLGLRQAPWMTLAISVGLWFAAWLWPWLNLPNYIAPDDNVWYFDPLSWQLLFILGALLAPTLQRFGGLLPRPRLAMLACSLFLAWAFVQTFPWTYWGLPDLKHLPNWATDKTHLAPLRLLHVAALFWLLLSSPGILRLARHPVLRALNACGRHSLAVFSLLCVLALVGRLGFRTFGAGPVMQVAVNAIGLSIICGMALFLERGNAGGAAALDKNAAAAQVVPAGARLAER